MLSSAQRRDLDDLQLAIARRDQQSIQYLLKRLLAELDYYPALAIVVERLHGWLDIFESYTDQSYAWVRAALVQIANYGVAPDEEALALALRTPPSEPGLGNYLKALHDLGQAMLPKHAPSARVGYLVSALVNVTMAELAESWYGERPDAWRAVRALSFDPVTGEPNDPQAAQMAYSFWTNSGTASLERRCWREIAQAIERALLRGASASL
ncbi:MAG: hypothetical protein NZ750_12535 [Anaerolineae bacterium]|nr:hypothetical protein [Anaerolineae bacterium]MDW8173604.1 hypothetical protein [Anaerolineae bacterium]